jgi:hypothetical protein
MIVDGYVGYANALHHDCVLALPGQVQQRGLRIAKRGSQH